MKYVRIDENTLAIYFSERDIYDADLNISKLFTADQKAAHDIIYNILKKVDPEGEFFDNEQLSIQMMPRNKGLVINIQKITQKDNENSENEEVDDNLEPKLNKETIDKNLNLIDDMKSLMKVIDDLVEEQDKEDAEKAANRVAYILSKTNNFDDIIELAKLGIDWHTEEQYVYYNNGTYYVLFKYPKGLDEKLVNHDFMATSEWLQFEVEAFDKVLKNAKLLLTDTTEGTVMQKLQYNFS